MMQTKWREIKQKTTLIRNSETWGAKKIRNALHAFFYKQHFNKQR